MEMLNIGRVGISNPLVLAPMAAVNCPAFRLLCRRYGAGLVYSPMIHADHLVNLFDEDRVKAFELFINFSDDERPVAAQLIGNNAESFAEAAKILSGYADIIDINFGCPSPDELANKSGAFFIKHPEFMKKVLDSVVGSVKNPVTAKIRIGWDDKHINALEVSKIIEDCGASAIAVHGRTRKQAYSGNADWDVIRKVKENVKIPVIGNGDIFKPGTAKFLLESTKVDFVMIGRAAVGNPFIFRRALALLDEGRNIPEPSKQDVIGSFFEFLKLYDKQKRQSITELKDQAMWFTTGLKNSKRMRSVIMNIKEKGDLVDFFEREKDS